MEAKMMAGGGIIDDELLTATVAHVREGDLFYGSGSDEIQEGKLIDRSKSIGTTIMNKALHDPDITMIDVNSDGKNVVAFSPPYGEYPGSGDAYVGVGVDALGIRSEKIANGKDICGVIGNYGADADITSDDIKTGKKAYGANGAIIGNMAVYNNISKTLAAGESFTLKDGFYGSSKISAKDLASQTAPDAGMQAAAAAQILAGFKAFSNGTKVTGGMTNNGAVSPAKLNPGESYSVPAGYHNGTGKVAAKRRIVKQISALAYRGFGVSENWGPETQSYTVQGSGTVYYSGVSLFRYGQGGGTCRIYKNGALIDSRDKEGNFVVRGTMTDKSFAVKPGDVIKVEASATSGESLTFINAVIEYFE